MQTIKERLKQLDIDVANLEQRVKDAEKIKNTFKYIMEWRSIRKEKLRLQDRAEILDTVVRSGDAWRY